jgi:hypothetical protein
MAGTQSTEFTLPDVGQDAPQQSEITAALQTYFDTGGSVPALLLAVQSQPPTDDIAWGISVFKSNVVGTTDDDWVIDLKLSFGERPDSFLQGMVFALTCDDNRPQVLEVIEYNNGKRGGGFLGIEAGVLAVVEMTDNFTAEIVLNTIPNIGLHSQITREYTIMGWDGAAFSRLIPYYDGETI